MLPFVDADDSFLFHWFHVQRRLMSCWTLGAIAIILPMLVGCGNETRPQQHEQQGIKARIWRDKETEKVLKLVAKTGNLCCYRYEGCFLDFFFGDTPLYSRRGDGFHKILPGQATSRSGLIVVVRTDKNKWEISSQERFSWDKVQQNDAAKKTVDFDDLGEHLSNEMLDPGNSSGSNESTCKGYSFGFTIPEDADVDFTKEDLGVTDHFKGAKEIPVPNEEPITLARFEIVSKDGKVHGGWDLRCVKAKAKAEEKIDE